MAYKVRFQAACSKRLKKIPLAIRDEILDYVIPQIQINPLIGTLLSGNWKPTRSFHFHRKPEYRILYRVYECKTEDSPIHCTLHETTECNPIVEDCSGLINFVVVGTREDFNRIYKLSKKDIDQNTL